MVSYVNLGLSPRVCLGFREIYYLRSAVFLGLGRWGGKEFASWSQAFPWFLFSFLLREIFLVTFKTLKMVPFCSFDLNCCRIVTAPHTESMSLAYCSLDRLANVNDSFSGDTALL